MRRYRDKRLFDRAESRFIWAKLRNELGQIRPVSTRCTDEEAASLFCDEWERKAADPAYRLASEATLSTGINDFLDEVRRSKASAATIEIAECKLGHFVRLWGATWPLLRITNTEVLKFIDTREAEGVKPYTVKKELGQLKRMLEWAKFRGTFPRDLATVLPPNYSGQHKPKTRTPSRDEVVRLLANMPAHRAAHVAYLVATGARWLESVRARLVDVDMRELVITLNGSKTALARGTVPITGITWDFVVFAIEHAPGTSPLFAKWSRGSYWRDIQAACRRAGIEPLSPNDLRRAFGGWHRHAIMAGGGGKESAAEQTSILLRHATDKLAQTTYARVTGAELGPSIRAFSPVPILTAGTAETTENDPNCQMKTLEKLHARTDSNHRHPASKAGALVVPQSPRSVGNKQAHARRKSSAAVAVSFKARARRWFLRVAA